MRQTKVTCDRCKEVIPEKANLFSISVSKLWLNMNCASGPEHVLSQYAQIDLCYRCAQLVRELVDFKDESTKWSPNT